MDILVFICVLMIQLFLFSVLGWLMEVFLMFVQYHRFINRGYFIGPYCPIYGFGVVAVTVFVNSIIGADSSCGDVFLVGLIVCGALEYFVSWVMERLFHARWWDYSTKPMNLHGRIWIGNLILFGLGSMIIVKWVNPLLFRFLSRWSDRAILWTAVVMFVLLLTDAVVSSVMMNLVKQEIDARTEDNTEEVSAKVRALLKDRSMLIRRINEAYPRLQARPAHLTEQLRQARRELKLATEHMKREMKLKADHQKMELKLKADYQKNKAKAISQYTIEDLEKRIQSARERIEEAKEKLAQIEHKFKMKL